MDIDETAPDNATDRNYVESEYQSQFNMLTDELGSIDVSPVPFLGSGPD